MTTSLRRRIGSASWPALLACMGFMLHPAPSAAAPPGNAPAAPAAGGAAQGTPPDGTAPTTSGSPGSTPSPGGTVPSPAAGTTPPASAAASPAAGATPPAGAGATTSSPQAAASAAAGTTPAPAPATTGSSGPQQVRVTTSMGDFVIELFPERAPLTVANFLRYVREGFYTGTLFHRVVSNFVIQGGGHAASDYRLKPVHDPVVNESGNGLQNKRGMVGLARGDMAHSGNAQFYVNLVDNPDLDPLPTRWGYAVFGRVVQGMDVVERIGVTATGAMGPFKSDAPLTPVVIQKIEIMEKPGANAGAPTRTPVSQDAILSPK